MSDDLSHNRDLFQQLRTKNIEALDKAILTLCSASLAFSLSVYEKIYSGEGLLLLILVWWFLGISILAMLYSFWTAAKVSDILYTLSIKVHNTEDESVKEESRLAEKEQGCYGKITAVLNFLSIGFFTLALILFIIFCSLNVSKNMSDKRYVQNGLLPPTSAMPKQSPQPSAPSQPQSPNSGNGGSTSTGKK